MNWGKAIILVFILFAGFIGTLVFKMMQEHIDLVRPDYYQDELAYQDDLDRATRTAALAKPAKIAFSAAEEALRIQLPFLADSSILLLYHPADGRADRKIALGAGQSYYVPANKLRPGLWRAKLRWYKNGLQYYHQIDFTSSSTKP
jgi:hypothetical protein